MFKDGGDYSSHFNCLDDDFGMAPLQTLANASSLEGDY